MIYFLYGLDTFRLYQRAKHLKAGAKDDSLGIDYFHLTAPGFSFADFSNAVASQSLLTANKMVLVDNLLTQGSDELKNKISNWLATPPDDVTVVFREDQELDKRTKLFKILNKFIVEQYNPLKPYQAKDWLKKRAENLNLQLSNEAKDILSGNFSCNLWRLNKELEKLAVFSQGDLVDKNTINKLVPRVFNDNIFQTIDALAKKNIRLANKLVAIQLSLSISNQQLLAMMAYQFRNIALLKILIHQGIPKPKLSQASQLHPYVVQKTIGFADNFTGQQLSKIFYILHRIDMAIKNGKIPPKIGLDILMAQIVNT